MEFNFVSATVVNVELRRGEKEIEVQEVLFGLEVFGSISHI